MKRNLFKRVTSILLSASMVFSCQMVDGFKNEVMASTINSDDLYVSDLPIEKVDGLSENFFMGADVSSAQALYDAGVKYYNEDGKEQDLYEIMADAGINYVRLRIWNDPYKSGIDESDKNVVNSYGGGVCDYNYVKKMALAAQKAGLKVLLDFHYSDFWADPSKQTKPKAWSSYNATQTANAVYNYTLETLNDLKADGVNNIGMVQVGNETTSNICGYGIKTADGYNIFAKGCQAVRDFDEDVLIALHFTNQQVFKYGELSQTMLDNGVDFDILSSSYYPEFSTHGSIESICANLKSAKSIVNPNTNKNIDVMISEVGYYYQAKTSAQPAYVKYGVSKEAQAVFLRDLIAGVSEIGGLGVFYWEPAWVDVGLDYNKTGTGWASDNAAEYDKGAAEYGGGKCATTDLALFTANSTQSKRIDATEVLNVFKYVYKGTTSATDIKSVDSVVVSLDAGDEIVLPNTVKVTLKSMREADESVSWSQSDIDAIDTNIEGDYTVSGTIDGYNKTIYATVEVSDRSIVKVEDYETIVPCGTAISLPTTLKATINGGSTKDVSVSWDEFALMKIDTSICGDYVIMGEIEEYDNYAYAFVTIAQSATTDNLVLNSGFESSNVAGNSRDIPNWTLEASVGSSGDLPIYSEARTAYEGSRRLSVWTGSYDNYWASAYQEIDISEYGPGVYEVSAYQLGNIDNISLFLKDGDSTSTNVTSKVMPASTAFEKTEMYVNITSTDKITVGVLAQNVAKSAYSNMDVISVKYCGNEATITAKNELSLLTTLYKELLIGQEVRDTADGDLQNAISNATTVLSNTDATDEEVENALNDLKEAANMCAFDVYPKGSVNGDYIVDKDSALPGETVSIIAIPDKDYELSKIVVQGGMFNNYEVDGNSFVMPASSVSVRVTFTKIEKSYLSAVLRAYHEGEGKLFVTFADGIDGVEPDMTIDGKNAYALVEDLSYGENWFKYRVKASYGDFSIYEVNGDNINLLSSVTADSNDYNSFINNTKNFYYNGKLYATYDEVIKEVNKLVFDFYVYAPGYAELSLMFANTTESGGTMFTISGWTGKRFYVMNDASDELGTGWFKYTMTSNDGGFQIYNSSNGHDETNMSNGWIANMGLDGGTDLYDKVVGGYVYYVMSTGTLYNDLVDTGVFYYGTLDKPVVTISESAKENTYIAKWQKVENATSYEVQIGGNTIATLDGDATSLEITASYSGSNRINVIAHAKGYYDGKSTSVTVYVPDEVISAKVTSTGDTTAKLEWVFTAGGEADGFVIYKKEGSASYEEVATVKATVKSYDITGLKKDKSYTFKVVPYIENITATIYGTSAVATLKAGSTDDGDNDVVTGPKAGTKVTDKKYNYKVTKAGSSKVNGEVSVTGLKKTNLTTIKIAATVTIDGVTYKVTSIGAKAFKNNKKIKKVIIGKNVKSIGVNAFSGCKKITTVTINSTALNTIGKSAFMNCRKLKKVIIKSTVLKKIGKKAFKGTKKKATFKVPKAKKAKYKKMIKKAGAKKPKIK